MIFYPFLILLLIGVIYIVGLMLLRNSQDLVILWGQAYTLELTTFTLAVGLLLLFLCGYLLIAGVVVLLRLPTWLARRREANHLAKAQLALNNGLVNLVEGHWAEAEDLLANNVAYSETPLLNYLGAAHAAHRAGHYEQRDEYLKTASNCGDKAEIAVAVSQASMQLESGQIEQSRATLTHLRELAPSHPYPNQLLAKVYYQQEDWKQLLQLLPVLISENKGASAGYQTYLQQAVVGLFESNSGKKDLPALTSLWQQLPAAVREEVYAVKAYCIALNNAGGGDLAASLLEQSNAQTPQRELVTVYGEIQHNEPHAALVKAQAWETTLPESASMLLCLGRLTRQTGDLESSANYYEQALVLAPDSGVYHEFAELLTAMGDEENAKRCYRQGLRYCVQGRAQPFKRKAIAS
ncbi:MAG: heme biosynthesis protein HemY [Proteobacteria bacterium]|nr:MAG: heme biosynthesis protein HemY [Pseudomonadota bacterium]